MRLTRVHVPMPLATGGLVELPDGAVQHLTRVLRLSVGAPVTLFNGQGGEYEARIESVTRGTVTARVGAHDAIERESPLSVTLLQGIARGEKMDLILQKATELGITRIVPVITARSNVRLTADTAPRKQAHWQGVVIGACEQCGRNRVPEVTAPAQFGAAVQSSDDGLKLLLAADAQSRSLRSIWTGGTAASHAPSVALLVGPEGGFDPAEEKVARLAGFTRCHLGPRVLRTETAALATLAALQYALGRD